MRGELAAWQAEVTKLREDNADLEQSLDELQAQTDARLSESARRALSDHLRPDVTKLTTLVGFEPRNWSL